MLPAISADLPAYLAPPSQKDAGRQTTSDTEFGPPTRVELSTDKAVTEQSSQPGSGLYGADGRFVEAVARRDDAAPKTPSEAQQQAAPQHSSGLLANPGVQGRTGSRDLSIEGFQSAIPPAAREELRSLADRVGHRAVASELSSSDYRKVGDLMERVGRHHEAQRAFDRAKALEEPATQPDEAEEVGLATEVAAEERAAEARGDERVEAPTPSEEAGVE